MRRYLLLGLMGLLSVGVHGKELPRRGGVFVEGVRYLQVIPPEFLAACSAWTPMDGAACPLAPSNAVALSAEQKKVLHALPTEFNIELSE